MNLRTLCLLLQLGSFVVVQGKPDDKGSSCERPFIFKKRDCAEPYDLTDAELGSDHFDDDLEGLGDDLDGLSLEGRSLDTALREGDFDPAQVDRLLGRDIVSGLANEEDHDALVERLVAEAESGDDIFEKLEAYYDISHHLEKRANYRYMEKDKVQEAIKKSQEHNEKLRDEQKKAKAQGKTVNGRMKKTTVNGYYKFCEKEGDLYYKTSPYTGNTWPVYDNEDWGQCDNYVFKKVPKKDPRRNKKKSGEGDGYITEHVLERQMIQQFGLTELVGKTVPTAGSQDTYCTYMSKYWEGTGMTLPTQAKSKWVLVPDSHANSDDLPPLYLVGRMWPQTKANKNEFVTIERRVNGAKEIAFQKDVKINADDSFVIPNKDKQLALAKVQRGHDRFKESVLVAKYVAHPDIQKIYKAQGDRVAEGWGDAEDKVEQYWAKEKDPYKPLGLKQMWLDWLKTYTETVRDKVWADIGKWKKLFDVEIDEAEKSLKDLRKDEAKNKKEIESKEELVKELKSAVAEYGRLEKAGGAAKLFANPWA